MRIREAFLRCASPRKVKSLLTKGVEKVNEVKRVVKMNKMTSTQKRIFEFEGIVVQESGFRLMGFM